LAGDVVETTEPAVLIAAAGGVEHGAAGTGDRNAAVKILAHPA
jgi:hypothetical protein